MAQLYSQYASGLQFTAGAIAGSTLGVSGVNAFVDRLNSITSNDGAYTNLDVGEGLDISNGSVVSAELATATNRGVSTFNTADFTVTNGSVAINDSTVFRSLAAGEGIDITGSTISGEESTAANKGVVIVAAGEGIDVSYSAGTATVAGENASTSNKGVASFNTNDFSVSAGAVSLKNKTSYWSCTGINFVAANPDTDTVHYVNTGIIVLDNDEINVFAPASLPNGAVVTGVIVNGDASLIEADTFELIRQTRSNKAVTAMSSAAINVEDTTISNATIDNSTYNYFIANSSLLAGAHEIYGARITYTTDYV